MTQDRPTIIYVSACLPAIINEMEGYLIASEYPIYQRDGKLIRVGRFPTHDGTPDLQFVEVCKDSLVEILTTIISWEKMEGKDQQPKLILCPDRVAITYRALSGKWKLPTLRAVITAPTMRPDGSILDKPGYDKATSLYFDPQGVEFAAIPLTPSKEDGRRCLDRIIGLIREVPFVRHDQHGEVSRSVFLSGVLSALIKTMLPAVPLHGFSAPAAGSGKTILVDGISYLLTGNAAQPLTQGDEEETGKRLSSALQAGYPIIALDNCEDSVGGALLCQAVTATFLAVRVFGKTELRKITNTAMYFVTGNNLRYTGDIVRRAVRADIDSAMERPEDRKFTTQRPDLAMRDNRAEIVADGLTVLRAFYTAGCPTSTDPVGNFEKWSQTVRDCLVWMGEPDPWISTEAIRAEDPMIENNITALTAWFNAFDNEKKLCKDVIDAINAKTESMGGSMPRYINSDLRDALGRVTDNELKSIYVGNWLSSIKDRPIGGYIATQAGTLNGSSRWRVIKQSQSANPSLFT